MNTAPTPSSAENALAERYARRVASRLDDGTAGLPYDISERLRASREQALARRKTAVAVRRPAPVVDAPVLVAGNGTAVLGWGGGAGNDEGGSRWWNVLGSVIPLVALVAGLVFMDVTVDENGVNEVAEVDAALLTDDLPPAAYADPGFIQFLNTSAEAR